MNKHIQQTVPIWHFDHLSQFGNIQHHVSGREGGVSNSTFESLNLSYSVSDQRTNVAENRQRLATALKIKTNQFLFPKQTHSDQIRVIRKPDDQNQDLSNTDGLITNIPGIAISVLTADCVPLLFYDRVREVIGAVHSGWRGTVKGIAQNMIQTFKNEFNSRPSDILVGIGPSIGPDTYEVGREVINSVKATFKDETSLILREEKPGKAFLNLWKANRILLEHMRVPPENIEKAYICTYTDHEYFFSARRLGVDCGRFGTGIMLNNK